jgi:hypothetical protein
MGTLGSHCCAKVSYNNETSRPIVSKDVTDIDWPIRCSSPALEREQDLIKAWKYVCQEG